MKPYETGLAAGLLILLMVAIVAYLWRVLGPDSAAEEDYTCPEESEHEVNGNEGAMTQEQVTAEVRRALDAATENGYGSISDLQAAAADLKDFNAGLERASEGQIILALHNIREERIRETEKAAPVDWFGLALLVAGFVAVLLVVLVILWAIKTALLAGAGAVLAVAVPVVRPVERGVMIGLQKLTRKGGGPSFMQTIEHTMDAEAAEEFGWRVITAAQERKAGIMR